MCCIITIHDLKFVGIWAPTTKIIGDIPDFNVLNVPKMQAQQNRALELSWFNWANIVVADALAPCLTRSGPLGPLTTIDIKWRVASIGPPLSAF